MPAVMTDDTHNPAAGGAPPLILASASPRRRKILTELGLRFEVVIPLVDEQDDGADPRELAMANAWAKNRWCQARHPGRHILSADTVVFFRGRCMGKPQSLDEARTFLRALSGDRHEVITATAFSAPGLAPEVAPTVSTVRFRALDDATIEEYIARVNPLDRAGAYDIDHHGELLIESFEGSRTNVMGLPAERVAAWLKRFPELLA